jgi:hypothetical protein
MQNYPVNAVGIQLGTTPFELKFFEIMEMCKTTMLWSLFGGAGYMVYFVGINTVFDLLSWTVKSL